MPVDEALDCNVKCSTEHIEFSMINSRKLNVKVVVAVSCRGYSKRALELAAEHGIRSIAFPSISTGAYGYPMEEAAPIAVGTVLDWLRSHPGTIRQVIFACLGERTCALYRTLCG